MPPDSTHLVTSATVPVTAGSTATANVSLDPAGAINATITAGDGITPLPNITLSVVGPSPGTPDAPEGSQAATTDSSGQASVTGLSSGNYELQVDGADVHHAFTISHGNRSSTVALSVPTTTVSGQIADAGGNGVSGVRVELADGTAQIATTQTDSAGNYAFTATSAGTYDIVASDPSVGLLLHTGVTVALNQTIVVPTMSAGTASLSVSVTAGGNPVANAQVSLSAGSGADQPAGVGASTDGTGAALLANLTPGAYTLTVTDGTDAASVQPLTIPAGASTRSVALGAASSIAGVVNDANSSLISGGTVIATGATNGLSFAVFTAANGAYHFDGLPAGAYNLSASGGHDAPAGVSNVLVTAGNTATQNVTLPTSASSLTVALDANAGGPLPGLTATLVDGNGIPIAFAPLGAAVSTSDQADQATIVPVTAGDYTLVVTGRGRATVRQAVNITGVPSTVHVLAPVGEALTTATSLSGSRAGLLGGSQLVSRRELGALVSERSAATPPPGFWHSIGFFLSSWSGLVPDPNAPTATSVSPEKRYANALNLASNFSWPCVNPSFQKAYAYLRSARAALNRWESDYETFALMAYTDRRVLASQAVIVAAAFAALIAGAAALLAPGAAGLLGTTLGTTVTVALTAISGTELLSQVLTGLSDLDANSIAGNVNNVLSVALTGIQAKLKDGSLAKFGSTVLGQASNFVNLLTSAIGAANSFESAAAELTNEVNDYSAAKANFEAFMGIFDSAMAAAFQYKCPPHPTHKPPPPPPKPIYPYGDPHNINPHDPNEIIGNAGDGSNDHFVTPGTTLPYTVLFQNNGDIPATEVFVTMPLPPNTDPSTVHLTGFGFGQTSVPLNAGTSFAQNLTNLNLANGDNVSASGKYDVASNTITWTIEAINPDTGDVDGRPDGGFLPPDDAQGNGEGYVSFRVDANGGLADGTKIDAQASIVFDKNAPIATPVWTNTIDNAAPTSHVNALPSTEPPGNFKVSWTGSDGKGSGVASFDVYASDDGKTFTLWKHKTAATSAMYPGVVGHRYAFFSVATDGVGNVEITPPNKPQATTLIVAPVVAAKSGYWMLGADGHVYAFGAAKHYGDAPGSAVAMAAKHDASGYWVVDQFGNVHAFGSAHVYGGPPALRAGEHVSAISATPSGNGYWLFTSEGRVFAHGDAKFFGDLSNERLQGPIVASVATPTGKGYYMVATDGGVFGFGDAKFYGSMGGKHLNKPVVGLSPTLDNKGYWLVASDGGVFGFGDAGFHGSLGNEKLNKPVNGLVAYGNGYLMVSSDGGVFAFSNKKFVGSLGSTHIPAPIIGVAAVES